MRKCVCCLMFVIGLMTLVHRDQVFADEDCPNQEAVNGFCTTTPSGWNPTFQVTACDQYTPWDLTNDKLKNKKYGCNRTTFVVKHEKSWTCSPAAGSNKKCVGAKNADGTYALENCATFYSCVWFPADEACVSFVGTKDGATWPQLHKDQFMKTEPCKKAQ